MTAVPVYGIRPARLPDDAVSWGRLRQALWPDEPHIDGNDELRAALEPPEAACVLLAVAGDAIVGFAEARLRSDYVNGTCTSPVGFLEAWYVQPEWRGRGIGRALVRDVEDWTRASGCAELASDALLDNLASHAAHLRCGFEETGRVVYFRKPLA
jgi:aminoglycoside 6'-N-acetyltransferase I